MVIIPTASSIVKTLQESNSNKVGLYLMVEFKILFIG